MPIWKKSQNLSYIKFSMQNLIWVCSLYYTLEPRQPGSLLPYEPDKICIMSDCFNKILHWRILFWSALYIILYFKKWFHEGWFDQYGNMAKLFVLWHFRCTLNSFPNPWSQSIITRKIGVKHLVWSPAELMREGFVFSSSLTGHHLLLPTNYRHHNMHQILYLYFVSFYLYIQSSNASSFNRGHVMF